MQIGILNKISHEFCQGSVHDFFNWTILISIVKAGKGRNRKQT